MNLLPRWAVMEHLLVCANDAGAAKGWARSQGTWTKGIVIRNTCIPIMAHPTSLLPTLQNHLHQIWLVE